jgi:hypothetical protein
MARAGRIASWPVPGELRHGPCRAGDRVEQTHALMSAAQTTSPTVDYLKAVDAFSPLAEKEIQKPKNPLGGCMGLESGSTLIVAGEPMG